MRVSDDPPADQPVPAADGARLAPLGPATDADACAAAFDDPERRALAGAHAHCMQERVTGGSGGASAGSGWAAA